MIIFAKDTYIPMYRYIFSLFFGILHFLILANWSNSTGQKVPESLIRDYQGAANDSSRMEALFALALYHYEYHGDYARADSLCEEAIALAEFIRRPSLLWRAYSLYFQSNDLFSFNKKALAYAQQAGDLAIASNTPDKILRSDLFFARVYFAANQYDKALESGYQALSASTMAEDDALKAECFLVIGRCLQGKNQMIPAFRNFLNASQIAEKLNYKQLLEESYDDLSKFYRLNKLYPNAMQYNLKRQELILKTNPVDSVAYYWNLYEMQVIEISSGEALINENVVRRMIDFADRHGHRRLREFEITLYRSHLIENNRISELRSFYQQEVPEDWSVMCQANPGLYFRLKAFFSEEENLMDSAHFYFRKAEEVIKNDPNILIQSKFYHRFGSFLQRHGDSKAALEKFSASYTLAEQASYFGYMLTAAAAMEPILAEMGNYRQAWVIASKRESLSDSVENISRRDQILTMEIDHEARQREILAEAERQKTERRHNLQYMAMVIAILSAFIILIMLGSLKVPSWIIRMLGFFSFIFLFEFIILLADHKIHHMTHGEPWKIILIKIVLIAVLLPFHHWIEKKVIAYLLSHRLIAIKKISILGKFRKSGAATDAVQS